MPDSYRQLRQLQGKPITERKGDRHKNPNRSHGTHAKKSTKQSKWERREIVAWDGEGYDITPHNHVYNLLANSNHSHILNNDGLSTDSIFDFFFTHSNPNAINVIFGGSYDVNMVLGDLSREQVEELWQTGSCYYKRYKIIYNHRKKFTLHRYYQPGTTKHDEFILWDVLGYFQTSFVNACRKWLGDLPVLDEIEAMKHERSTFEPKDINRILQYCYNECDLLVQLTNSLFSAMDEGDIALSRYDGAGSIAAALLRKYSTVNHRGDPTEEAKRWAQFAYSGGWIEAMKIGNEERSIYRNDINSAYPSAAMSLPSYNGATWTVAGKWNGCLSSLVRVCWNFKEAPYYPLFYREPDGAIIHPKQGEGIYFGCEIANLFKYHPNEFEIVEALNVTLMDDTKPFDFIAEVYKLRMLYKSMGSMASEALKLGMNSVYGKLAQQAGYRNGRIPTYHHLLWAGEITARTRDKLYAASMQKPHTVIAFATDAIISTDRLSLPYGGGLGEWTPEEFHGITIIQPGVYFLQGDITDDNPTGWHDKYRGFDKGAILREGIVSSWEESRDSYTAYLTRFITMGSALARKPEDFRHYWRTWTEAGSPEAERRLDIRPVGKRVPGQDTCYAERLCDTMASVNMHTDSLSAPYPLEWVDGIEAVRMMRPVESGVDMRVIEQDYEDSYA